ncbi:MAG: bifunctional transaldolase/phosoglucose isomerase [Deltaproteobacteria bacterium]|nr:bifunctional transaldolase/phosoglucose isomerase [Deltaproteobacteria bacterium]
MNERVGRQTYQLPEALTTQVNSSLAEWRTRKHIQRLWARDASVWTGTDEGQWLGWLSIVEEQRAHCSELEHFAQETRTAGFRHALVLGMGGSSLCPEVLTHAFGQQAGCPRLHVLDSTDPAQVMTTERGIDLAHTLFIVASKSGSTLEPNIFKQYFFERVRRTVGAHEAGQRFVAITDPGSKMQQVAESDGFRRIFFGVPSIGGRYSALSSFGMVPAAVMGLDVRRFLDRTAKMVKVCGPESSLEDNPGVVLGTILGVAAHAGRDKMTVLASPRIADLGTWLEQLVAESTGKDGKGIIPVDREPLGSLATYGTDRLFVYVRFAPAPDVDQDAFVAALERAGQPVVRIVVNDVYDLGQEFFRWEIATAVAGAILGINPFNQPDVEASKVETRQLTTAYEQTGALPAEAPLYEGQEIALFTDDKNAAALRASLSGAPSLASYLRAHLQRIHAGDYCALLAYLEMDEVHLALLQAMRRHIRDHKQVATCVGFGPRFLHSTGQAYKGGPNSGVFLQITCDDAIELPVAGQRYTFGVVKAAQARGDFQVLADRQRRVLRVHLGKDVPAGLATLRTALAEALT